MRRTNMPVTILFAAIVILVSSTPASADTTSLLGKPAPDFSLTTLNGKFAKLSAQKGKVVVLCFWQSSDPADLQLLPYIQQFSANQDWASKGLVVWAIAEDNPQRMAVTGRKLLKDSKYTFDVPYDSTAVGRSYLLQTVPTTIVIGSDGIIKSVSVSFWPNSTPNFIAAAVERAFAESGKLDAAAWIGSPAPAFLITAPNGAAIHLDGRAPEYMSRGEYDERYVGKVLLITFWADRNSSASILPHIQELATNKDFARKGLVVMAVATSGQTPADVRKFLLDNHYTFEVPFDTPFASWEDSLGKEMATFVIGRGVVTGVFAGASAGVIKQIDDAVTSALDSPFRDNHLTPLSLIGKPAPDFSLTTLNGKTVRLSDQRGKVVLLDFWASWCQPCLVTLPHTQELSDNRDLANKGLVVWAVTEPDDKQSLADARMYVVNGKYTFAVPCDSEGIVEHAYGITGFPHYVLVGRDGLIKNSGSLFDRGQFQPKNLDDRITSALAEPPSAVASNLQRTPPPAPSSPAKPAPSSPPPAPSSPANPAPYFPPESQGFNNLRVLCDFDGGTHGQFPRSELIFDDKGNLYGTTYSGGVPIGACGTVFRLTPGPNGKWSETILHSFQCDLEAGRGPHSPLVLDKAGNLWGIAADTIFEQTPGPNDTWSETVFSFPRSGGSPIGGLTLDAAGNFYGETQNPDTVFELTPVSKGDWRYTSLYNFPTVYGLPSGGVILDAAGNLYGVTQTDGLAPGVQMGGNGGAGTVFKLTRGSNGAWVETVLHRFTWADGAGPEAGLVFDAAGNLYGTTGTGGPSFTANGGYGTVFKLTRGSNGTWSETVLHSFDTKQFPNDGLLPRGHLILDAAGNVYGVTQTGGLQPAIGTVFKLSQNANGEWIETVLHNFRQFEPQGPMAGLVFDAQGNLYGTTDSGGVGNRGTVFQIPAGSGPAASSNVQPTPPSAPSNPANPRPSSPAAPQGTDALASTWQSDAYAGQTFGFKLDGDAIDVYGSQQELLGTLQAKKKNGAVDVYQGLVQIAPVTQCPGGRGLMQIKGWNENRLDAKIETPVNTSEGVTCGGVLGSGRLVPWQKVTFVKR